MSEVQLAGESLTPWNKGSTANPTTQTQIFWVTTYEITEAAYSFTFFMGLPVLTTRIIETMNKEINLRWTLWKVLSWINGASSKARVCKELDCLSDYHGATLEVCHLWLVEPDLSHVSLSSRWAQRVGFTPGLSAQKSKKNIHPACLYWAPLCWFIEDVWTLEFTRCTLF